MGTGGGRGGGAGAVMGGEVAAQNLATELGGELSNVTGVSVTDGGDVRVRNALGQTTTLNPQQQRSFQTSDRGINPRSATAISQPTRGPNGVFHRVSPGQRDVMRRRIAEASRKRSGRAGPTE